MKIKTKFIIGISLLITIVTTSAIAQATGSADRFEINKTNHIDKTVKTWGENRNIPEDYHPNLATVRHHLRAYNMRGSSSQFKSSPSPSPNNLKFFLHKSPAISKEMESTYLASYLMYEGGLVVVDEISPVDRFGDLIDNHTQLYSMSLGKSLAGYLMGHAICKGYIGSLDDTLFDWPIIKNTLISKATVRDVINATMGDQEYFHDGTDEFFISSGRNAGDTNIADLAQNELANSNPSTKKFAYGQLPANIALNYISFKTGHRFSDFINDIFQNHVGLEGPLVFNGKGSERLGPIQSNFKANRYDTLRIGISILNDWNSNNCVGRYLKDVYASRVKKGRRQGDGFSTSYAGFFHTDYLGISDTVMGMDGYGGIALLINFDDNRIIYTHAAHRNYNYKKVVLDAIKNGDVR